MPAAASTLELTLLVPFAAGNFIYIGASDRVPEVNCHRDATVNFAHFASFVAGIALLWGIHVALGSGG